MDAQSPGGDHANNNDGGFELVDNQQPPPEDVPDEQFVPGTAVLEEDDSFGSFSDEEEEDDGSEYLGSDVDFSEEDMFSEGELESDSEWEDVDEDDDSIYSIPTAGIDPDNLCMLHSRFDDSIRSGFQSSHCPWEHGGCGYFQQGRTVHHAVCTTYHKQAADSLRIVPAAAASSGKVEIITCANMGPDRGKVVAVWQPAREIDEFDDSVAPFPSTPFDPPCMTELTTDRPLTLTIAHGGRVVFTGGLDHKLEVFFQHVLPSKDEDVAPTRELLRGWSVDMGGMVNCLTVGTVAGQQRLIVSVQVDDDGTPPCRGHVLIMELPPPRSQQPGTMSCEALQRTAQGSTQGGGAAAPMPVARLPVTMNHAYLPTLDAHGMQAPTQPSTHVAAVSIGPWPYGINCAVASPDGKLLAVVGDSQHLWLLHEEQGYAMRAACKLPVPLANPHRHQHGCQYVAWSHDSRQVAVTADSSGMCVCVFDARLRVITHRIAMQHPMMAVAFCPWDASLLVCAQRKEAVHVVRLLGDWGYRDAKLECGLVRRMDNAYIDGVVWRAHCLTRVITGMEIDASSRSLYIAQPYRVLQYHFVESWRPEVHAQYPPRFKAAARALLLAAKRVTSEEEDACGLWAAPAEVLLHVLARSAAQLEVWFEEQYHVVDERARLLVQADTHDDHCLPDEFDDYLPSPAASL